jgi:hypothetical protein
MKLPLQREVKEAFRHLFQHGEMKLFAAAKRDDPADVSRQYSAERPEVNQMYLAVVEVACAYAASEETGDKFVAEFNKFCAALRPRPADKPEIQSLKSKATRSIFEVIGEEVDGLPMADRLKAVEQAKRDLANYENGLRFLDCENAAEPSTGRAS